ncbi:MAG: AAA15 family ATPase/GTPase [Sulfurimonas sp.]|jgi:AAA15 family ATPase/GTPase|uniref:AAA family ATPase n=1 Tax=Sulfurimonas sp. TaxID=2022749 RepID=UPI0039E62F45
MLKNIEIIDYKCFQNFKLEGLSQINIISGGNNVGKTALLEALFIQDSLFDNGIFTNYNIVPFLVISKNRDISDNQFTNYLKKINFSTISNNRTITVTYKEKALLNSEEKKKLKNFNQDYFGLIVSYVNDKLELIPPVIINLENIPKSYINSSKPKNKTLVELYSRIQTQGIQQDFLEYLQILDPNIAWIEPQVINNEPLLRINLKYPKQSLISSELGEGTNRYIEILATLLANPKGLNSRSSIFIDEIENGIHYSKLKDIWKALIEIVQKEKIQLFVTTHDKESIEALIEASEELKYEDISSIQLYKDEKNNITPIVMQYDNFAYGINRGADVR